MAVTTSTGLFSGVNTDQLIQQILSVESQPITALQQKSTSYQGKISSYGSIKSALSKLQDALANLKSGNIYSIGATSSDTSSLTATATSSASEGTYNIKINNLATAQSVYSTTGGQRCPGNHYRGFHQQYFGWNKGCHQQRRDRCYGQYHQFRFCRGWQQ